MADEIQHRQAEDKMCWEKSLSAKNPIDLREVIFLKSW